MSPRVGRPMARCTRAVILGLARLVMPGLASAQPVEVPDTWGGDLWSRPGVTGDWFGLCDELGKKGVVFDVDLLLTPQGVASGGRDTGAEFWGHSEYTLNVATQKLGLWPGGFLRVKYAYDVGASGKGRAGAPAGQLRDRLASHGVQRQLRALPAQATRSGPRPGGRGRDVHSRAGSTRPSICRSSSPVSRRRSIRPVRSTTVVAGLRIYARF